MGIPEDQVVFMLQARNQGVTFTRTLTIGRQHVNVSPKRLRQLLREFGAWPPPQGSEKFLEQVGPLTTGPRFDGLAAAMGAQSVDACDLSAYEGATFLHDMNLPVSPEKCGQYDVVIDGGSLEHVFNFPVAIQNCMGLVKTGGTLFLFTPTNNYGGHGFYQFSPELFYRVLCPANGFDIVRMMVCEGATFRSSFLGQSYDYQIAGHWYAVKDPATIRKRVLLLGKNPSVLMIQARKIRHMDEWQQIPQQSDYALEWQAHANAPGKGQEIDRGPLKEWMLKKFGEAFCLETLPRILGWLDPFRLSRSRRKQSLANRECYLPHRNP
jgi:SAM-dependent methyltransferase